MSRVTNTPAAVGVFRVRGACMAAAAEFGHAEYAALRGAGRVGALVHAVRRTASTMDDARAGADARGDAGCGDAYLASEQTAGRGRFRRPWAGAPGASLLVTYHLCVSEPARAPLVGFAGALAAARAVTEASGLATALKWPNDVLAGGRKLAGVLAESRPAEGRADVFLGVGVNLGEAAIAGLPPPERARATSIEGEGAPPPGRERLLAALSRALGERLAQAEADPAGLHADWRSRLATIGARVRLSTPGGEVEGLAAGVTAAGQLVLRLDGGGARSFAAGDVTTL